MLAKLLLVVCMALAANANEQLWNEFKVKHGKTYATETEQQLRYAIFTSNLELIEEHNAKYAQGLVSWYKSVNQFTDLTPEEFKKLLTLRSANYTKPIYDKTHVVTVEAPSSIDWRDQGVVTGVKDQGQCGSCWTFSITGALEGLFAQTNGYLASLSEQNILDCCTHSAGYDAAGCDGGYMESGFTYVKDHGIATEESYPYETKQETCKSAEVVFQTKGYVAVTPNDESALKNAVGTIGPISIAINADGFGSYGGGIYDDQSCTSATNHGVIIVGYASENGQEYWLVKNSWGANWGEAGYIRVAIGHNICAIASEPNYPYV